MEAFSYYLEHIELTPSSRLVYGKSFGLYDRLVILL